VRGYLITGDETFLAPYRAGGNAYTAAIEKVETHLGTPSSKPAEN